MTSPGRASACVPLDKIIVGQDIRPGDVVIGLPSSGIHSNGLTLARDVFFSRAKMGPEQHVPELGRSIGEELLEPTRIYVREVLDVLRSGVQVKALAHITSDGLTNLLRVQSAVGYVLDTLPEPPPVFRLLQRLGGVSDEEMFQVYNMGVGFCLVVDRGRRGPDPGRAQAQGTAAPWSWAGPSPTRTERSACPTVWWDKETTSGARSSFVSSRRRRRPCRAV